MQLGLTIGLLAALTAFALWKESPVPFMVAGGAGIVAALFWYDYYSNGFGLAISIVLVAFSFYLFGTAFRAIFVKREEEDDEE